VSAPSFADVYRALHSRAPFPWQRRLADTVLRDGWPALLDLPTGAGKTSALDVALYTLARAPDRMPRRTVLVVDRRVVVDQGADHARELLEQLGKATDGPAHWLATQLRTLFGGAPDEPPFAVAVMRGGMPRDNDWARRPDQPVLGVSTIDQLGSRLLFRGYGVSSRSASIHAGLLGNDLLVLLDEVHLAVPFAQTLDAICGYRASPRLPDRFRVVAMSATPGGDTTAAFRLDRADRADAMLARRLAATKLARLEAIKNERAVAERAVKEALALQAGGANVVGIVVNRVDTARSVYAALAGHDAVLVTGRMRPIDRDRVVHEVLLPRARAGRDRAADRPLVVVATQCIEAGADLDFDAIVTECAALDALRQRFGRVDRRGELGRTQSVILGHGAPDDPIYGAALDATWQWLEARATDGVVDLGIDALADAAIGPELLAPQREAPVLLPAHLDALAQTSQLPAFDVDVGLWLHGPDASAADVQLVWRAGVASAFAAGAEGVAALRRELDACRPSALEAVTVPLAVARRWLAHEPVPPIADVVDREVPDEPPPKRPREEQTPWFRWRGDDDRAHPRELRPGDILVLDCAAGGLRAGSFDPASDDPVVDLGDLAQLRGRGRASMRFSPGALAVWGLPPAHPAPPAPLDDESRTELRDRIEAWIAALPDAPPVAFVGTAEEWARVRAQLRRPRIELVDGEVQLVARDGVLTETSDALTEDDDSAFRGRALSLAQHSGDVQTQARAFGEALGLPREIVEDLALAGWLHDVGKADPRFQRWLVGGSEVEAALGGELLAKSALPPSSPAARRRARERAGYPAGYRHELLSLAMIERADALRAAHDPELVLHLVASHHGWCRPFAPALDDPDDVAVALDHAGTTLAASTRHRRARLDSGVADRFWSLTAAYGWWGLAWLEAVLRLADHRASELAEGA
jgi:CRISPR-associated endonuclease/helicase Cas3